MFGRGKRSSRERGKAAGRSGRAVDPRDIDDIDDVDIDDEVAVDESSVPGPGSGPYDVDALGIDRSVMAAKRLDFGSIMLPFLSGAELQVEIGEGGRATGVHMQTQFGRITIAALAAPKSPGQWREMAREMADLLRKNGQTVTVDDGTYGREIHAASPDGDRRFIGFDGYRWMVRAVATGAPGTVTEDSPLVRLTRAVLSETAVVRGPAPHPARNLLPIVLPKVMVEHLQAQEARRRALAEQGPGAVGVRRISPTDANAAGAQTPPPQTAPPQAGAIPNAARTGTPAPATGGIPTGPRTGATPTGPGTGAIPTGPGTGAVPAAPGTGAMRAVPGGRRGAAGSAMQQLR